MKKTTILTGLLVVISIFLSVGSRYIFPGCQGLKENGDFMRCHWAQNAITLVAATNSVIYLFGLITKNTHIRAGMVMAATITNCAVIALANNIVIKLCMSKDMHCFTSMKPMVNIIASVIIILGVIDYIFALKEGKNINVK